MIVPRMAMRRGASRFNFDLDFKFAEACDQVHFKMLPFDQGFGDA